MFIDASMLFKSYCIEEASIKTIKMIFSKFEVRWPQATRLSVRERKQKTHRGREITCRKERERHPVADVINKF